MRRFLAQLTMLPTMMVVFRSLLMIKLRERARSFHVPSMSWMKAMKVDGLFTGPNGITLYANFVELGPANASFT
jgi:hypothetical protein